MACSAKHTKYQPTPEEWRCPRFGRTRRSSVARITSDLIGEARRRRSTHFYMEIYQEPYVETWQEKGYRIAGHTPMFMVPSPF